MAIDDEELADALDALAPRVAAALSGEQEVMVENLLVARAKTLAGGDAQALAWYQTARLAGFGGLTPAEMVRQGEADAVLKYIQRVESGGYA